jgi:hypothetical protein
MGWHIKSVQQLSVDVAQPKLSSAMHCSTDAVRERPCEQSALLLPWAGAGAACMREGEGRTVWQVPSSSLGSPRWQCSGLAPLLQQLESDTQGPPG